MANAYTSSFTGAHNDEYNSRISTLEGYNAGTRLTNLEGLNISSRLNALEQKTTKISYDSSNTETKVDGLLTTHQSNGQIWANSDIINGENHHYYTRYNGTTYPIVVNHGNSNISYNAVAGGNVYLGAQQTAQVHLPVPMYLDSTQIRKTGEGSMWISGRDYAMIRSLSCPGYTPTISIKTNSGSWQIGSYSYDGWWDKLVFSYTTDANYNSSNNVGVQCTISTAGAFQNASKRELKENIKLIDYSCLDVINSIEICSFNMIADPNKEYRVGFIADDTDPIVSGKEQNSMDIQNCIGVMMKAIQELSQEIDNLKTQLRNK